LAINGKLGIEGIPLPVRAFLSPTRRPKTKKQENGSKEGRSSYGKDNWGVKAKHTEAQRPTVLN